MFQGGYHELLQYIGRSQLAKYDYIFLGTILLYVNSLKAVVNSVNQSQQI